MSYARIDLSTMEAGQPGPLPISVVGLADASLADLGAAIDPVPASLAGIGFWPVDFAPVTFDSRCVTTVGSYGMSANAATKRVVAVPDLRPLTAEEVTALPPLPQPDPYADFVPLPLLRQRIEKLGMLDPFAAYLADRPPLMMKVFSLERGIDPAYPDLAAAFDEMAVPQAARDYILAPPSDGVGDPPAAS